MKRLSTPQKIPQKVRAIYPGSFDPFTRGHLDILDRALSLFSEITIVVAQSIIKQPLFPPPARLKLIRDIVKSRPKVKVDSWDGLIMDYARRNEIQAVIRGLRAASDFENEFMMATMNKKLNPYVETVFVMSSADLFFVSSSMIREIFRFGGDVSPYVPEEVARALNKLKGN